MSTPNRGIPYVPQGVLDPAAAINASLDTIDAIVVPRVISMSLSAPPVSPGDGDLYVVAASPAATDAWSGLENRVVRYRSEGNSWQSFSPEDVYLALNTDDGQLFTWDESSSGGWMPLSASASLTVSNEDSSPIEILCSNLVVADNLLLQDQGLGIARVSAIPVSVTKGATMVSANQIVVGDNMTVTDNGSGVAEIAAVTGAGWTIAASWTFTTNVAQVDFIDLGVYEQLMIIARGVTKASSGVLQLNVSVDNGSNFYTTAGDYVSVDDSGLETAAASAPFHATNATAARTGVLEIKNNIGTVPPVIHCPNKTASPFSRLFVASVSAINALRVTNSAGGNLTGGSIFVLGR